MTVHFIEFFMLIFENFFKIYTTCVFSKNFNVNKLFDNAVSLFLLKWEKEVNFLAYFKKMWLKDKRTGWYQGFAKAIPDHNNNNESDNRYIKEDQDRKRLGLIQFLNHAEANLVY